MRNKASWVRLAGLALAVFMLTGKIYGQSSADLAKKLDVLKAYPDLIVVNGKISTIDARNTEVQAIAVRSGRIVAAGTNDEVRFLAGPKTEVLDAKGRRVLPGLIDGHTHPHLWAVAHWLGAEGDATSKRYNDPQLKIVAAKGSDGTAVLRSLEQTVRQRAQELGPGKWIWVFIYGGKTLSDNREIVDPLFLQETGAPGTITRQYLDTLAPNNPLIVMSPEAIGPGANNTLAMKEMEKILGTEVIGLTARDAVTYDILLKGRDDDKVDFLKRELLQCVAAQGVTTFSNHYYNNPSIMKTYNLMYQRGELPVRWAWWTGGGLGENVLDYQKKDEFAAQYPGLFYNDLGDSRGIGNDYIWNVGVSNEGWEGGISCTTAAVPTNPKPPRSKAARAYRDGPGRMICPSSRTFDGPGYRRVKAALDAGLRIGFLHHYSDGTFDALFNMIEEAINNKTLTLEQVRALRISTEHTPMIRPDQMANIAKYNIMPGFNGYQIQGNIKGGAFLQYFGEQYMSWLDPMKSVLKAGAHPVFNTDVHLHAVPPEFKDMDYPEQWNGNIWGFFEFFVTRRMPSDGVIYNASEAMDRTDLIRSATIWGAEQLLNEKNIGSLEVGKLADFTILDKDFFTIPGDQIHTIKSVLTATGGKVVFKDPSY